MKKILTIGASIAVSGFFLFSCNDDDDDQTIESIGKIKVDSVKVVSDTMDVFSVQSIRTYSAYASHCEGFYGYDYIYDDNLIRTVTAYKYTTNGYCVQEPYTGKNQINFSPQKKGTYTFEFWNGDNNWITKTIVVR